MPLPPAVFSRRRRLGRACPLVLLASIAAGCGLELSSRAEARDEWRKQYEVNAGATIEIRNTNGGITVRAGDGRQVDVRAVRVVRAATDEAAKAALAEFRIEDSATADRIVLDAASQRIGFSIGLSRTAEFEVTVPRDAELVLESTNGNIVARGIAGRLRANGTNGSVRAEEVSGPVQVELTNGRVELDLAAVADAGVTCETTNGALFVTLPPAAKARIAARTSNGGIDVRGLDAAVTQQTRQRVEATVGGGGPTIRLETTNGAIRVSRREAVERQ